MKLKGKHTLLCYFALLNLLIFSNPATALTSFGVDSLISLSWGNGTQSVALEKLPAHNEGPLSIEVDEELIYLLDDGNHRILSFHPNSNYFSSTLLNSELEALDFCLDSHKLLHVLFHDRIVVYDNRGHIHKAIVFPASLLPVGIVCTTLQVQVEVFSGSVYSLEGNQLKKMKELTFSSFISDTHQLTLAKKTPLQWLIQVTTGRTSYYTSINVQQGNSILSVNPLGMDNNNNIYFIVEEHVETSGNNIERHLYQYDAAGNLVATMKLLHSPYAYMLTEFAVDPSGGIIQMIPSKKSLVLAKIIANTSPYSNSKIKYKSLFNLKEQTPDDIAPSEAPSTKKPVLHASDREGITRDEVIKIAKQYLHLSFDVTDKHISTTGSVITPVTKTGTYTGMPYQWGGFHSIDAFLSGLEAGKKAGDRNTKKSGGNSTAVGVDCSGFVSSAWQLKHKHSTRNLADISVPIGWDELKKGDILNHAGSHVRLFAGRHEDGEIAVYESAAAGGLWKVIHKTYTHEQLEKHHYKPYRYKYIRD
ncbi:hypothetical protein [Candidatus Albibeggiatoa sp. nov. NOAA]|uniref:hypothetical protein n=1 Tax=Candidatus Albibeggiatoa sp. nov. NOAA TaxID=3162724 RepID=UPI003301AA1E|nr:hypothetical protein [Thiotrichaceae bacterium]